MKVLADVGLYDLVDLCTHYVVSQEGNLTRSDHDSGISGAALIKTTDAGL